MRLFDIVRTTACIVYSPWVVMILEIFSFECYFPRDLLSDFEIQMRIRQRRST